MKGLPVLLVTTVGSAAGWWVGARVGIMTAFIASVVGFGIDMWAGAELARRLGR